MVLSRTLTFSCNWCSCTEDARRTDFLWNLPGARERLRILEADLLQEGSFDSAVEGVHGVFHTACPVLFEPKDDPQVCSGPTI